MYIMISAVIVKGDTKSKDTSQVQNTELYHALNACVFSLLFFGGVEGGRCIHAVS